MIFNWPKLIVWLSLLYEILDNMCIVIVCYPGYDVINFEINLIFLIKPFLYMTKKSRQELKYLENKFFIIFKGLSVAKNYLWPSSAPLTHFFSHIGQGEKRFVNLKKRYSKKKSGYKNTTRSGAGSKEANAAEQELKRYGFLSWLTRFVRLKDNHSNLGETFFREDGDDSIDMDSPLPGSENEVERKNQLIFPKTIDSVTTSSNLKKNSENKKVGKIYKKEYKVLEKLGKSLMFLERWLPLKWKVCLLMWSFVL